VTTVRKIYGKNVENYSKCCSVCISLKVFRTEKGGEDKEALVDENYQ
jgi:hypothetical protein